MRGGGEAGSAARRTRCIMPERRDDFKVSSTERQIVKALGSIGSATALSRVAGFVREHLRRAGEKSGLTRMALVALQMALGSSSQAAAGTLQRLAETPGLEESERVRLSARMYSTCGTASVG